MNRTLNRAFWLVAAAAAGGCATLQVPPELPKTHRANLGPFSVVSNRPLEEDPRLFVELERLEEEIQTALPILAERQYERSDAASAPTLNTEAEAAPASPDVHIYLFDDPSTYKAFMSAQYPTLPNRRAYFIGTGDEMAVYTCWTEHLIEDIRHELTHALLHARLATVPLWLDEGLAEYFEAPGGWNAPHAEALALELQRGWQPDLYRLEKIEQVGQMQQQDYREAWAWVHFLLSRPADGKGLLLGYLEHLRTSEDPAPFTPRVVAAFPEHRRQLSEHVEMALLDRSASIGEASTDQRTTSSVTGSGTSADRGWSSRTSGARPARRRSQLID